MLIDSCFVYVCRCGDMFENGSYLRRRKRFKLTKKTHENTKNSFQQTPNKTSTMKTSFFIENLLANDTNASYTTTPSSSPTSSSETSSNLQQVLYPNEFELLKKFSFLNDIHSQQQQQQAFW